MSCSRGKSEGDALLLSQSHFADERPPWVHRYRDGSDVSLALLTSFFRVCSIFFSSHGPFGEHGLGY